MADADYGFPVIGPGGFEVLEPAPPPPPVPAEPVAPPLDYFRPNTNPGDERWYPIARFATTAKWHRARAALGRGSIEALMGAGENIGPDDDPNNGGIILQVREGDVGRALIILDAVKNGSEWCPRCGSVLLEKLRLPWWWIFWSVLFLGIAPFEPPRFACRSCGHRWN